MVIVLWSFERPDMLHGRILSQSLSQIDRAVRPSGVLSVWRQAMGLRRMTAQHKDLIFWVSNKKGTPGAGAQLALKAFQSWEKARTSPEDPLKCFCELASADTSRHLDWHVSRGVQMWPGECTQVFLGNGMTASVVTAQNRKEKLTGGTSGGGSAKPMPHVASCEF